MTQPISSTDRVARGVVSAVGAGLFLGLGPASAIAGWWLVAGMALAAALTVLFALSTPDYAEPVPVPLVGILGRIAAAAAVSSVFGRYVLPGRPEDGAVVLVIIVAAVVLLSPPLPGLVDRVAAIVVLGVLAVVAAACFAIAPVGLAVPPPPGAAGADDPVGLVPAAVLLFVCFAGSAPRRRRERVAVLGIVAVVSLAVAAGVLYQLGGERLALSTAPLHDALAAADASGVSGLLAVGVTVSCVFALRGVLDDIRAVAPDKGLPVVAVSAVVAALCALLLDPEYTLVGAAVLLLAEAGIRVSAARRRRA